MWRYTFGVFFLSQVVEIIDGVKNSQHRQLESEMLLPVSFPQESEYQVIYEGSGESINDEKEDKVRKQPVKTLTITTLQPETTTHLNTESQNQHVIVTTKLSESVIVLIVILILLLMAALVFIGYLWRKVKILQLKYKKPFPQGNISNEDDEYSVMMDWSVK